MSQVACIAAAYAAPEAEAEAEADPYVTYGYGLRSAGLYNGYKIEEIENHLTKHVRYLDKLVDELAKGRKMEKILRA